MTRSTKAVQDSVQAYLRRSYRLESTGEHPHITPSDMRAAITATLDLEAFNDERNPMSKIRPDILRHLDRIATDGKRTSVKSWYAQALKDQGEDQTSAVNMLQVSPRNAWVTGPRRVHTLKATKVGQVPVFGAAHDARIPSWTDFTGTFVIHADTDAIVWGTRQVTPTEVEVTVNLAWKVTAS